MRAKSNLSLKRPRWRNRVYAKNVTLSPAQKKACIRKTPKKTPMKMKLVGKRQEMSPLVNFGSVTSLERSAKRARRKIDSTFTPSKEFDTREDMGCIALPTDDDGDGFDKDDCNDSNKSSADIGTQCPLDEEEPILEEMFRLLPSVMESLKQENCGETMKSFFQQVDRGTFPLKNTSFWLWLDVVRWYQNPTTTMMRYSDQCKMFWKLGWRIFGTRFLNFMSGDKNDTQLVLGETVRGRYDPQTSSVNFAVPSTKVLRSFDPYDVYGGRKQGVLTDMVESFGQYSEHRSACLTYDGKKLKLGLTPSSGDVDLLGFEKSETLIQKQMELKRKLDGVIKVEEILSLSEDILSVEDKSYICKALSSILTELSSSIELLKGIKQKKLYAKSKLMERGGEQDWRNSKYKFAISAIIAFIFEIDKFLEDTGILLDDIAWTIARLNNCYFSRREGLLLSLCPSYVGIQEDQNTVTPRNTKQRSSKWFELRKSARVTGSTLYKALGLDGMRRLKEHFDHVVCGVPESSPSEEAQKAMAYGSENEINAVATAVGKALPVLYPGLRFHEEGCIEIKTEDGKPFMIVSPDGSLRKDFSESSTTVGIEIKCPTRKVHNEFPSRYLLQCLAEIEALDVENLLFISWSPDVTNVFTVPRDRDLFSRVMVHALDIYGPEKPTKPTKLPAFVKSLKEEIDGKCKSILLTAQFKSLVSTEDTADVLQSGHVSSNEISSLCTSTKDAISSAYELNREKASEAMIFLCCDLNRHWNKDSISSVPVCWFPKGYSLPTDIMRQIVEMVSDECHEAGIHIPAQAFDGQWHNIAVRAVDGSPLTILQLQKDVWKEVEKIQKSSLIVIFRGLNKDVQWVKEDSKYICTNGGISLPVLCITKSSAKEKPAPASKEPIAEDNQLRLVDTVPEWVLQGDEDHQVLRYSTVTSEEAEAFASNVCDSKWNEVLDDETDQTDAIEENESNMPSTVTLLFEDAIVTTETETNKSDISSNNRQAPSNGDAENILALLQTDSKSNKDGRWTTKQPSNVLSAISTTDGLQSLRDVELKVVLRYFKQTLSFKAKESCSKQKKIDVLGEHLLIAESEGRVVKEKVTRKNRRTSPKTLKELASCKLSKCVKKGDLSVSYAGYIWPDRFRQWKSESCLSKDPKINDTAEPEFWFYTPEFSRKRNQLEVRCIDSTHLLTRTRRVCCRGGLDGVSNGPWLKVAKEGKTFLSLIMVQEVVEPMSTMMAATHFSEPVEIEMRNNGHVEAANLCRDIRMWWKAEDDPGIQASDRILMRKGLRDRLLRSVHFDRFPPRTQYIKGWPIQLWEALLSNIDAKSQLYAICHSGTYNVRAFSSLMGETFFSELTLNDKTGHGTVTAEEFGQFIGSTIERLQV